MALTKSYSYRDINYDELSISKSSSDEQSAFVHTDEDGVYLKREDSVPAALNILGHDRPVDDPIPADEFWVGDSNAGFARTKAIRDRQADLAAALLTAVDAYDQRVKRLATAEERRQKAAASLTASVARLKIERGDATFGNAEIGKLREALGRYDAELAN
jgi:hypothetical protein